jgi:hypothetical protein
VISAKVNKHAVVRNRLRRLLHRHLLACLQPPIAIADRVCGQDLLDLREAQSTRCDGQPPSPLMLGSSEGPLRQQAMGSTPGAMALATPAASATGPTAPPGGPTDPKAGPLAEPKPQPAAAGQPAAVLPNREPPVWLMVSLRPGSAELDADQLLGECTIVLRRAGLIP